MSKFIQILKISVGLLTLVVSAIEFSAQTFRVIVTVGPVTFGPISKIEASGLGTIYFKGSIWYAFLSILILLMILGILLLISGVLAKPLRKLFK